MNVTATVKLTWRQDQIDAMLRGPGGEVAADIERRGQAVATLARKQAPVATGRLRNSIAVTREHPASGPAAYIGASAPHAVFVESGTGLFGRGTPIRPVHRRVLHWTDGREIFARQTRGARGRPFLATAIDAAQ